MASNRTAHFGAKAMAKAIARNKTLVHLDMTSNDIDDDGLRMIADALSLNSTLLSIKLYYNNFG